MLDNLCLLFKFEWSLLLIKNNMEESGERKWILVVPVIVLSAFVLSYTLNPFLIF